MSADNSITRREFNRRLALAASFCGAATVMPGLTTAAPLKRRVAVMSDIHMGRVANDLDGSAWFGRSLDDFDHHGDRIDLGLTLGDITHNGDRPSLERYLMLRDRSRVGRWFQLAGNHEYRNEGIRHYLELVGNTKPYCHVDGNVAWFFLSDERPRVPGNMTYRSYRWLKANLRKHRDKNIIFCSHQLLPNTLRRSDEAMFCIHPREKITALFEEFPIALSLCGHEHHQPYSHENQLTRNGTTYINAASISHAYGTGASGSIVLELENNAMEIVARRRNHDKQSYDTNFEIRIPVPNPIALGR